MDATPTIVNMTLEFSIQIPKESIKDLDLIAETMLQGAANAVPSRSVSGLGFTYDYTHKKSRRGMTIRARQNK